MVIVMTTMVSMMLIMIMMNRTMFMVLSSWQYRCESPRHSSI